MVGDQLSKRVVNLGELRRLACQGVPDGAGIRQTVWKVLITSFQFDLLELEFVLLLFSFVSFLF